MTKHIAMIAAAAALLVAPAVVHAAPTQSDFVKQAIKGDNSEIMLGQLAQARGGTKSVRDFGQTLVTDHTKAKQQMTQAAASLNITPPKEPMAEAQAEYKKLSTMSGKAFDAEFLRYMVKDHKTDIMKFKSEANANAGQVSQLADQQLPTLQKHLKMAQSLQQNGKPPQ